MAFTRVRPEGIFAVWGSKAYKSLDKDQQKNSYYVKKGESLEGLIASRKPSKIYGYIFEVKVDKDTMVVVTAKTQMLNQMGYKQIKSTDPDWDDALKATNGWVETDDAVQEGELVQINFNGLEKSSNNKEMYVFDILVDRD